MAPRTRNLATAALRIGLSALALYLVFRQINTGSLVDLLQTANPTWLLAGVLLYGFSKLLSSFRLTQYFHANGILLSEIENLRLYWIGMFYNLFLPGGIGGDAYKVWVLHRDYGTLAAKAFQSVLFDRLSGLFTLAALAFLTTWLSFPEAPWSWMMLPGAVLTLAAMVFVHLYLVNRFKGILFSATLFSLAVQLAQLACAWTLLRAVGVSENTGAYLAVFLVSSVAAVLPISVGGVGIRELVFIVASPYTPVSQEAAVAFSLLFFVVGAVASLPGAFVRLKERKIRE